MFTLVSSDATELFRRHALDILCYPSGHVTQFRYAETYVDKNILKHCGSEDGTRKWLEYLVDSTEALIVYAECPIIRGGEFAYCPLRYGRVLDVRKNGSIVYVDVQLDDFPDLSEWNTTTEQADFAKWMTSRESAIRPKDEPSGPVVAPNEVADSAREIKFKSKERFSVEIQVARAEVGGGSSAEGAERISIEGEAWFSSGTKSLTAASVNSLSASSAQAPKIKGEGTFLYLISRKNLRNQASRGVDRGWESVVDQLAPLQSMENVLFYRVLGFFHAPRSLLGRWYGKPVRCGLKERFGQGVYPLPMGCPIELKVAFYRPRNARPDVMEAEFTVLCSEDAFSKVPDTRIQIQSRYDEATVHLVTKRVFDNVLAPVAIRLSGDQARNCAAEPVLLTIVPVPAWVYVIIFPAIVLVSLFLGIGESDVKSLLQALTHTDCATKPLSDLCGDAAAISWFAKAAGALISGVVGVVVFRRLPGKSS